MIIAGAAIVTKVLGDPELKAQWYTEVKEMADRIISMRSSLRSALEAAGAPGTWNHVTDQIGMFCYSGMTGEMVCQYVVVSVCCLNVQKSTFHQRLINALTGRQANG